MAQEFEAKGTVSMEVELTIDPEFAALCPEQTAEELANLEFSLEKDGCLCPIVTWANHDDTILDGHTRYRICTRDKIPFKTKALAIKSREDAINWIIATQLGRRNLSDEQKSYLRGKRYLSEKLAAHRPEKKGATVAALPEKTAGKLAVEYGVSERTIHNDADFAEAVDAIASVSPEAKKEILSGKSGATRKEVAAVASLPPEERKAAAKQIASGERWEQGASTLPKERDHSEADKESDALFHLKNWWRKAKKKDRTEFLKWINDGGK